MSFYEDHAVVEIDHAACVFNLCQIGSEHLEFLIDREVTGLRVSLVPPTPCHLCSLRIAVLRANVPAFDGYVGVNQHVGVWTYRDRRFIPSGQDLLSMLRLLDVAAA